MQLYRLKYQSKLPIFLVLILIISLTTLTTPYADSLLATRVKDISDRKSEGEDLYSISYRALATRFNLTATTIGDAFKDLGEYGE